MIKYLDIQAITAQHAAEYQAAAHRVIDSGWYLLGNETEAFEQQMPTTLAQSTVWVWQMV